ncbi:hypothetical protein IWQ60_001775 [Tieghemiomyces parasiticus]|uniref:PB1 domain-containing protein n=1 Tax=Tieghemiomyces parasiticus TaxID=78921 RepID=A0A9W8AGC4_9FUNG|nr:hypothetical protein IWQ60_001775 [Tieghemiomyces parasiticus]
MAATSDSTPQLSVKLYRAEECRRVMLPAEDLSIEAIQKKVQELYDLDVGNFALTYQDSDGDCITVSTTEELQVAIREGIPAGTTSLKLSIQSHGASVAQAASPTDAGFDEANLTLDGVSGLARTRFGKEFNETEILSILRDISLFICARDLGPDVLSSVTSEKSLITPQNATLVESKASPQVLTSRVDPDKTTKGKQS